MRPTQSPGPSAQHPSIRISHSDSTRRIEVHSGNEVDLHLLCEAWTNAVMVVRWVMALAGGCQRRHRADGSDEDDGVGEAHVVG